MSKFNLRQMLATPGALDAVEAAGDDLSGYVSRHATGARRILPPVAQRESSK